MRARVSVAAVILVVSAGLSAAADGLESFRFEVPRKPVTAYAIPGLEPWLVVRTQGGPQTPVQPKGGAPAAKTVPPFLLRSEQDKRIARIVYDAAVVGTQLWEAQNYEGTFRLYQGTVAAVQPFLDHHPKLSAQALEALKRSANMRATEGAFVLREVLDAIQKETAVALTPKALWDRLGGEKVVRELIKDFVAHVVKDKQINLARGTFKPEGKDLERLEQALVEAISEQTGGPLKSAEGMGLKSVLAGTKLTQLEFYGLETNLKIAMRNKISDAESKELLQLFSKLKDQLVGQ
jgi:truncated hemoglobin YjbI